jgi:GT2 family glycosyltransferase
MDVPAKSTGLAASLILLVPKLSVIIVAYGNADTIHRCIGSLPPDAEVIIVENVSTEPPLPDLKVSMHLRMDANLGFGRACNRGLREASGECVLILNPDAWASGPDEASRLMDFLHTKKEAVAVGARLVLPSGKVQPSCARQLSLWAVFLEQTFLERLAGGYWIDTAAALEPLRVPQVTGACFAMKRIAGNFLRFDDRFFLYCEDTELMKRLAEHGEIWHDPRAVFGHELGHSSAGNRWFGIACYNRGKELYFEIHHGKLASWACYALNRFGALLRLILWAVAAAGTLGFVARFRRQIVTFAKVLAAPADVYKGYLADGKA